MSAAVRITRTDHTANELRRLASKETDGSCVRRLLGIALILEGQTRETAAREAGMERQTLRDWVHRYNAQGLAGLRSIRGGGRSPHLSPAQMAELQALTLKGPDPETHKVVRWRCVDLRAEVARRFEVTVDERTIGKWLRKMGLTRLQPRPYHTKRDAAAQEAFKKQARASGPPGAVETVGAMFGPRGAAGKFLVDVTPLKNVAHGLLRTYEW